MPNTALTPGPTAQRVARNVNALRRALGWDLKDLSAQLAELGQPVSLGQLSKLERGDRRVDVDDLVALAVALDVAPSRLLLTAEAGEEEVNLTPTVRCSAREAWRWSAGEEPLRRGAPLDLGDRMDRFTQESAPHVERDQWTLQQLLDHRDVLAPLARAAEKAIESGVPEVTVHGYLRLKHAEATFKKAVRRGKR